MQLTKPIHKPEKYALQQAHSFVKLQKKPAIIWWDEDYQKQRVCSLDYYEHTPSIEESDVILVVE